MPYDEGLAERIREVLHDRREVVEKRMFGGIAFLLQGHMAVGILLLGPASGPEGDRGEGWRRG